MEDSAGRIKRTIAAMLIAGYGLAISFLTYFMFMWDNKGAKSIWDKSIIDWAVTIWLAVASLVVWYAVIKCASTKYIQLSLLYVLAVIFVAHLLVVAIKAEDEAIYYLGSPHLFLGLGFYLWWRSIGNAKKRP
ncbi:hypothetical protein HF888_09160 [Bermanella marisrubri]|uniref:Uncharacterized protein n=1 Tax=Bermanella marisrubri TaxID=207949 RepID=Q1N6J2_9GAMM|nr:hypothetical protein [Bermanella marisrubri]EAT13600.1 hypothetical protein RED65_09419 [Oceanobacter sp. RED65] [Bermanella marisrubri]QIZ84388.1 hypothetical protein HF888_09160 [Bermanella marisrubri]